MYLLCLIDWENRFLGSEEYKKFTTEIMGTETEKIDNWTVKSLNLENLGDIVSKTELGFYHSRLIFTFNLKIPVKDICEIRNIREKIQKEISRYCHDNIIPTIERYDKSLKKPHIFGYSIFELNKQSDFWKFKGKRPFSTQTTCFFTELDDSSSIMRILRGGRVRMRVSGAKLISTTMSDWFFNNIVNLVFHEGLYRLTRDNKNISKFDKEIHYGLEKILEDFARELLISFHSYSSDYLKRNIQKIALFATAVGLTIAIINFVRGLFGT